MGAALLSLALAVDPPASPASMAAADAFREGCTRGALALPANRGRIMKDSEMPDFGHVLEWSRPVKRTVIKFTYPPSTYLIVGEYRKAQPGSIAKACVLISHVLTKRDAIRALTEGTPDIVPLQTWWPNMYFPEWTVDLPKLGYRKRMRIRDDGSILLEAATYAAAAAPSTPEARR